MKKKFFITGISTEVGKTIASAIVTEALQADYWKPIQSGDLDNSDSHKIKRLLSSTKTKIHANSYALKTPMSPHAAAAIDGVKIEADKAVEPETPNHLVIEGAGGVLVPLNARETIADLIKPDHRVLIVSRHYLGSINHTLLTIEALKRRNLNIAGIIVSGDENPATESVIEQMGGVPIIGRIAEEKMFDREVVKRYAEIFAPILQRL
ncbi:dethiobiotin synthase [Sinomicrobium weinanense]|uniref:ATP-dependent dethiobiotin synthetase BioD n=1 Tax=Sinomicrobium weinanense TaxID=2842200 RepID=A0A926JNE8_9FLAO|nr:dethiobiotin synthase [Sinomicrobium weinanense]MBC9794434.1 dethiobiotin synthase [Sinomicrobium weinanense]MBU3124341.1 dethiobiotin synthase [Sinomicrobium weinanense]